MLGFGTHLDPELAVRKAVCELLQLEAGFALLGELRHGDGNVAQGLRHWLKAVSTARCSQLRPSEAERPAGGRERRAPVLVAGPAGGPGALPFARVVAPGLAHFRTRLRWLDTSHDLVEPVDHGT